MFITEEYINDLKQGLKNLQLLLVEYLKVQFYMIGMALKSDGHGLLFELFLCVHMLSCFLLTRPVFITMFKLPFTLSLNIIMKSVNFIRIERLFSQGKLYHWHLYFVRIVHEQHRDRIY